MDSSNTADIQVTIPSSSTVIHSQPGSMVSKCAVEIKAMTKEDCEFAAQMNIEAFRNKISTAVGPDKVEAMRQNIILEMSTRPVNGYDNHFIAWLDNERVGYMWLKYHNSRQQKGEVSLRGVGFCCGGLRLLISVCIFGCHKIPKDMCYLDSLAVDSKVRGRGVGGQLLAMADQEALKHGCSRISLHVAEDNPALRLYERSGYKRVDQLSSCWLKCTVGVRTFHEVEKRLTDDTT